MSELDCWLMDAAGRRAGVWYLFVLIMLQLVMGVVNGIFYAVPFGRTTDGGMITLAALLVLQMFGIAWCCFFPIANDLIDGWEKACVFILEAVSTGLLMASTVVSMEATGEDEAEADLVKLSQALELASSAATVLIIAIYIPLVVTIYDSFLVPFFGILWKASGNRREICAQIFITCVLVPYEMATHVFGIAGIGRAGDALAQCVAAGLITLPPVVHLPACAQAD